MNLNLDCGFRCSGSLLAVMCFFQFRFPFRFELINTCPLISRTAAQAHNGIAKLDDLTVVTRDSVPRLETFERSSMYRECCFRKMLEVCTQVLLCPKIGLRTMQCMWQSCAHQAAKLICVLHHKSIFGSRCISALITDRTSPSDQNLTAKVSSCP